MERKLYMRALTSEEFENLKSIAKMTQPQLYHTLNSILVKLYGHKNVISTQDGIIARGKTPVMLVAHLDTVFHAPPQDIYYDREHNVIWSPDGLGADDRAGVYAILKILSCSRLRPYIAFTTDEEKGCVGATNLSLSYTPPKNKIKYIIELDRRGSNDCVFYHCSNEKFINFITNFGFTQAMGSFSDIVELCPQWGICGVNLSIGYENEHSYIEILYVSHMLNTISKVIEMLQPENIPEEVFQWEEAHSLDKCARCGKELFLYEQIPISDGKTKKTYCGNCIGQMPVEWCDECYDGYLSGILKNGMCPTCLSNNKKIKYFDRKKNTI